MTRRRSRLRRVERWLVGLVMAAMVFFLERLVISQIEKKERARLEPSPTAVSVGEG
jgi:hypothetical protein